MLSSLAGVTAFTTGRSIPGIAVTFAGFALSNTRRFNPVKVARDTIGVTGGSTVLGQVVPGTVSTKNAPPCFGKVWVRVRVVVMKGRVITRVAWFMFV